MTAPTPECNCPCCQFYGPLPDWFNPRAVKLTEQEQREFDAMVRAAWNRVQRNHALAASREAKEEQV